MAGRQKKAAVDESIRLNKLSDALHPETDPERKFYRRFCVANHVKPEGFVPCHICQAEKPEGSPPMYVEDKKMPTHCVHYHGKAKVSCDYKNCCVLFRTTGDKMKHMAYVHEKTYGWWIPPSSA